MIPSPEVIFDEFIALSDTPADYTGVGGLPTVVNVGETGVEFAQIDHGLAISAASRADDDHPLYHTDGRGDARYYLKTQLNAFDQDPSGASLIGLNTSNFDNVLTANEINLQLAIDALDDGGVQELGKVDEVGGITKGQPVYVSGASGEKATVSLASNLLHDKAHTLGVAAETKSNGQNIRVVILGHVSGVDTSGFTADGDRMHLADGTMQTAVPTSGAHLHMGFVVKKDATEGNMLVFPESYVHDIRATPGINVEIACGMDDATKKILFQNWSRDTLGSIWGDGQFDWNGDFRISKSSPEMVLFDTTTDAIVSQWSHNEIGGITTLAALVNKPTGLSNALDFDGIDDYVTLGNPAELDFVPGTDSFTISLWFKPPVGGLSSNGYLISKIDTSPLSNQFYILALDNGTNEVGFAVGGSSTAIFSGLYNDDDWNYVALTANTSTFDGWLNGVKIVSARALGGTDTNLHDVLVGARRGATNSTAAAFFEGIIDAPKMWGRVLADSDIIDEWNAGSSLKITEDGIFPTSLTSMGLNLAGLWQFDESSGTNAPDTSVNSNDGTLVAMTDDDWVPGIVTSTSEDVLGVGLRFADGLLPNEEGRWTYGHPQGRHIIEGKTIEGNIAGTKIFDINANGTLIWDNSNDVPAIQIIESVGISANTNMLEQIDSSGNLQNYWTSGGGGVINDEGNDVDWRVGSVGQPNALFVQGSNGFVGAGTNVPVRQFHVYGTNNSIVTELESNFSEVFLQFKNTSSSTGFIGYEGLYLNLYADNKKGLSIDLNGNIAQGSGVADVDLTYSMIGENNTGVFAWMEDEDYFKFEDDIFMGVEEIFGNKFKVTSTGGYAVKLTNKTGSNTIAGQLVIADTANNDAVILTPANSDECLGVFLDSGVVDGSEAWVVVSGIIDVAMTDNTASTRGFWVHTSTEVGYADSTSAHPIAAPTHFQELGHCIESVAAGGAGTHVLARCILHFN